MARVRSAMRLSGWVPVFLTLCILASACRHYTIPSEEESGGGVDNSGITAALIAGELSARDGIWIEFSAPMDRASVEENLLFSDSEGVEIEPVLTWLTGPSASVSAADQTTDILKISAPLPYCDTFHITIFKEAKDAAGLPLAEDARLSATTGLNPLNFDRGAGCTAEYLASCADDACFDKGVTIFNANRLFELTPIDLKKLSFTNKAIWHIYGAVGGAIVPDATGDGWSDASILTEVPDEYYRAFIMDTYLNPSLSYAYADIKTGAVPDDVVFPAGTGDVDGDGLTDQVIGQIETGTLRTYLMIGGIEEETYLLPEIAVVIDEMPAGSPDAFCRNWGILRDVSGDGLDDIALCENGASSGESGVNEVRVLFGATDPATIGIGARVISAAPYTFFDAAIAGDVNGDGVGDLIVREASDDSSTAYVFFGPIAGQTTDSDALTLADANVVIDDAGEAGSSAPTIIVPGDLDGDGRDDLLIGDRHSLRGGTSPAGEPSGAAYIVLGRESWNAFVRTLTSYDLMITGAGTTKSVGMRLGAAGDMDNDGYDDFMVGAYDEDYAGHWHNIFLGGPAETFGGNGVTIDAADAVVMKD